MVRKGESLCYEGEMPDIQNIYEGLVNRFLPNEKSGESRENI